MATEKKQKVLTIKHKESTYRDEVPEEEFNNWQPRIQEMYDVTGAKDVPVVPQEVADKPK